MSLPASLPSPLTDPQTFFEVKENLTLGIPVFKYSMDSRIVDTYANRMLGDAPLIWNTNDGLILGKGFGVKKGNVEVGLDLELNIQTGERPFRKQ